MDEDSTKLIQKEGFSGIVIPFASLGTIEEGYNHLNKAPKQRAGAFGITKI